MGNTRAAFQINNDTPELVQKSDYYPFGMQLNRGLLNNDNKYLYNGKELQDDLFANGSKLDWLACPVELRSTFQE